MFTEATINGAKCWLTRTGYTGEDGFEISLPKSDTLSVTKALLKDPAARLCGLGARDSLRLEAGMCTSTLRTHTPHHTAPDSPTVCRIAVRPIAP